ncbi:MAG: ABC-2 family transporter protein [Patescibacteria group bacterium]|nr:ABC-2 family transporter protein [Patescibacteria group bacterium]MCL5431819.1 ABC-2 family transporter protein [Patescibacteria group bacterium]
MKRYFKVWRLLVTDSIQSLIATRWAILIFVLGKLLRLGLFFSFAYFLFTGTKSFLGYDNWTALLFVSTFYLISSIGQMFFREIYRFRSKIVKGEFDFDLIRPIHPLLRNVFGDFDLQDLLTMPVLLLIPVIVMNHLNFGPLEFLLFFGLCVNGLLIMFSVHVVTAALIIFSPEVDHGLMMYRDIETMARFPVDIYKEPLRSILTFVIPLGIIFTFPVKALLGLLSWPGILASFLVGIVSVILAMRVWNLAIRRYSSASS